MITEAKDQGFLAKLQETLSTKKKLDEMKNKDREIKYKYMLDKLQQQRQERNMNRTGIKPNTTTNKTDTAQRLLKNN